MLSPQSGRPRQLEPAPEPVLFAAKVTAADGAALAIDADSGRPTDTRPPLGTAWGSLRGATVACADGLTVTVSADGWLSKGMYKATHSCTCVETGETLAVRALHLRRAVASVSQRHSPPAEQLTTCACAPEGEVAPLTSASFYQMRDVGSVARRK